jgi:hypothetical protein
MQAQAANADKNKLYRARLKAGGGTEVLFQLPLETLALIDDVKQRLGLRSRSQALLQLLDQRRATAQNMT